MRRSIALLVAVVAATATCVPKLANDDSVITAPRILAVKAEPAEAAPGTPVTFTALVASPDGTVAAPALSWSFCTAPRPLTEDNVVSSACLDSSSLVGAGAGTPITAQTPPEGCSLFGPDTSSSSFRPRDPDATGGFYQPLRVDLAGADSAFELARIHCDRPDADATAAATLAAAYTPNQNPTLLPLTATVDGAPVPLTALPAGTRVMLEASWPAESAETFAYFDAVSQSVGWQRESMQVAWYATGGSLDTESTGRASADPATTSDDAWTAPSSPATVHLWLVLRDSRGGVDFAAVDLTVR